MLLQFFHIIKYIQVSRNINQIKICMEAGRTVVLLNLSNLYESLYDLLNQVRFGITTVFLFHANYLLYLTIQYYVRYGGERYVGFGLQTHNLKCRVHKKFK